MGYIAKQPPFTVAFCYIGRLSEVSLGIFQRSEDPKKLLAIAMPTNLKDLQGLDFDISKLVVIRGSIEDYDTALALFNNPQQAVMEVLFRIFPLLEALNKSIGAIEEKLCSSQRSGRIVRSS